MGWTHYWRRNPNFSDEAFENAASDCKRLLSQLGIDLRGERDGESPLFSAEAIIFNGKKGQGCENFEIHRSELPRPGRDQVRGFCKTEKLPYDLCVQCALIILKQHLGQAMTVSSDGDDADWEEARSKCQKHLGYGSGFRLEKETT
jgi:hypothetical protein